MVGVCSASGARVRMLLIKLLMWQFRAGYMSRTEQKNTGSQDGGACPPSRTPFLPYRDSVSGVCAGG